VCVCVCVCASYNTINLIKGPNIKSHRNYPTGATVIRADRQTNIMKVIGGFVTIRTCLKTKFLTRVRHEVKLHKCFILQKCRPLKKTKDEIYETTNAYLTIHSTRALLLYEVEAN
jgi:hypothetical protein